MSGSEMQKYEKELCESYDHKQMAHILAGMEQTLKDTQKLANEYYDKCNKLEAKVMEQDDLLKLRSTLCGDACTQLIHDRACELEKRHQADCITINQLNVTIDTLIDKLARLREMKGL